MTILEIYYLSELQVHSTGLSITVTVLFILCPELVCLITQCWHPLSDIPFSPPLSAWQQPFYSVTVLLFFVVV